MEKIEFRIRKQYRKYMMLLFVNSILKLKRSWVYFETRNTLEQLGKPGEAKEGISEQIKFLEEKEKTLRVESDCRNVVQKSYHLQISTDEQFVRIFYNRITKHR